MKRHLLMAHHVFMSSWFCNIPDQAPYIYFKKGIGMYFADFVIISLGLVLVVRMRVRVRG